jgi:hypothetical protein
LLFERVESRTGLQLTKGQRAMLEIARDGTAFTL